MKSEEIIEELTHIRQCHEKNEKALSVIDGLINKEIIAIKNHQLGKEVAE